MLRRTKIIATLGPSSCDHEVLEGMVHAGMNVARINFSHEQSEDYPKLITILREISATNNCEIGIIADLQGPKIRIRSFSSGKVLLKSADEFFLDTLLGEFDGNTTGVGVDYENLHHDININDKLLLDDGKLILRVERIEMTRIYTKVIVGGELSNHKGVNFPAGGISVPVITKKDRQDIKLAAELRVDFLAVSFVRCAKDVCETRLLFEDAGGSGKIISKIERAEAYENLDELIEVSDALMVARGDLGIEMGFSELTGIQKEIIRKTRRKNKVVITATEMMQSMIHSQSPTRAEVADVSNAVMDGTDAVMLSAETAIGDDPIKVVSTMSEVCRGAEKYILRKGRNAYRIDDAFQSIDESIAMAAMYTANHFSIKAIIAMTESGSTPLWMSRIRSDIPIYALTNHKESRRRVTLYRGVYPVLFPLKDETVTLSDEIIFDLMIKNNYVNQGDLVILTKGSKDGLSGGTNSMRILKVISSK